MNMQGISSVSAYQNVHKIPFRALEATRAVAQTINQKLAKENMDTFEKSDMYTALYMLEYEAKQKNAEAAASQSNAVSFVSNGPGTPYINPYIAAQSNIDDIAQCLNACRDYVSLIRDYEAMANDMSLSEDQRNYAAEGILRLKEQIAVTSVSYVKLTVDGSEFQNGIRWSEEASTYVEYELFGEKAILAGVSKTPSWNRSDKYSWDSVAALTNHITPESLGITGLSQKSADEIEQALTNALAILKEESEKLAFASDGATSGLSLHTEDWGNSHVAIFEKMVMQRGNNDYWVDGKLTEHSRYWDYSIYGEQLTDLMHEVILNKLDYNVPEESIRFHPTNIIHLDVRA